MKKVIKNKKSKDWEIKNNNNVNKNKKGEIIKYAS